MYQVDAFTSEPFKGNPAAVCVFETWPKDTVLQDIAAENNLAETAFIIATSKTAFVLTQEVYDES